jgi:anti-sigma B factor antagonist
MELTMTSIGAVHVIRLKGTFSLGAPVDEFRSMTETVVRGGHTKLVLVLSDVPMMDSSAIGALVRTMSTCKASGGNLKLVNPSPFVLKTLKIVGLLNLFEIHTDEKTAAESYGVASTA